MKKLLSFLLLSSMIALTACTDSSSPCSDASNVDNAECQKLTSKVSGRVSTSGICF